MPAPQAEKRPERFEQHGRTREDDYAWLRAGNWQEVFKDTSVLDPAIRAYLEAENAYQDAAMAPTAKGENRFSEIARDVPATCGRRRPSSV